MYCNKSGVFDTIVILDKGALFFLVIGGILILFGLYNNALILDDLINANLDSVDATYIKERVESLEKSQTVTHVGAVFFEISAVLMFVRILCYLCGWRLELVIPTKK